MAAAFVHRTSRSGDPQLHSHVLLFNRAQGVDGRWGGLDGKRLFGWAKTAGYVYQATLRSELTRRLGVAWRPVAHGMADLAGFTDTQLDEFSTRRQQITAALEQAGYSTARSAQVATLATRPAKAEPVDPDTQRAVWRQRAAGAGLDPERLDQVCHRQYGPVAEQVDPDAIASDLASPTTGLTAMRSSFDRRDVIRAACEAAGDGATAEQVRAHADHLMGDYRFAPTGRDGRIAGPFYSTHELMALEAELINTAVTGPDGAPVGLCQPADIDMAIAERPSLSGEQEAMVRHLCADGRPIEVVVGRGGTGKTFALDAARDAWTRSGRTVIGAALAARTAAGLQAGTGIPSTTVDQLLADAARPGPATGLPRHGVLVVDEAGLVGTRKLHALVTAAQRARTKVVLVGDPRQLPEVEAGGAFAALAAQDPIQLTVNRRQSQAWERAALDELRHGDVGQAVTVYRERHRITLAPSLDQAVGRLVADWHASYLALGGDEAVMIALHQSDVDLLNAEARRLLQASGRLAGPPVEAAGREFAVGDEVMALRNDRRLGVTNGTRGVVTGVDAVDRTLLVTTADDRKLWIPASYIDAGHLTHGFALTAHKSQGITVSRAFVLGSDRLYREAGYTTLSRARERSDLYQVAPPPPGWQPARDPHVELTRLLSRSGAQELATPIDGPIDRTAVRDAALADPGAHLIERLGPPPPAGPARNAWAAAATAIDTYRQRHQITGPDPLGPPPDDAETRRQYEHAQAAARQLDRQLELTQDLGLTL